MKISTIVEFLLNSILQYRKKFNVSSAALWNRVNINKTVEMKIINGKKYYKAEDIEMLVNIISHLSDGEKINESFYNLPFEEQKLIYGWKFDNEKEDKSNE